MEQNSGRKFQRTDFNVRGFLKKDGSKYHFYVKNISLKGVLITLEEEARIEQNETIDIIVQLPSTEVVIETRGRLVREEEKELGFIFESIDPESMIHLRRLLELNTGFEGEIEKELGLLKQ